jgi:hypothetical protein
MCGRYAPTASRRQVLEEFVVDSRVDGPYGQGYRAPTNAGLIGWPVMRAVM